MPRTLEELEGQRWGDPTPDATPLVARCHALRQVPVDDLTPDEVRMLLVQGIGVEHLVAVAHRLLDAEPTAPTDEADEADREALADLLARHPEWG